MKAITNELKDNLKKEIIGFAGKLRDEGMEDSEIGVAIQNYSKNKMKVFYKMQDPYYAGLPYQRTKTIVLSMLATLEKADSKAEAIFYRILTEHKIPFQFQVEIGPYRVDYLIGGVIVFEGDGPHHDNQIEYDEKRDKYLKKQGYDVMRMKWELVAMLSEEIIDAINDRLREHKIII